MIKKRVFLTTLIFVIFCMSAYAKANDIACDTVEGLGIMESGESEKTVTRGEFARIILKLCRIEVNNTEWQKSFFDDVDMVFEESSEKTRFEDVSDSGEYYNDINKITEYGIMNGISENEFYPDGEIKYEEAVKTLIKIFGYSPEAEYSGGYPEGYVAVADKLGMSKKIDAAIGDYITRRQLAQIIYNSLDVNIMRASFGSENVGFAESDKTVLQYVLGLEKISGTMTQNFLTDLYTPEKSNSITVEDMIIRADSNQRYLNELLGHEVEAYYDDDELVWICKSKKDQSLVIDGDDIEDFSDGVLTYYDGRSKKIVIESGTPVIYNGLAVSELTRDMMVMQGGSVEIIQNSGDCDTVIIRNYQTYQVSGIDAENGIIYNALAADTEDEAIDVYDEENYVVIRNSEGTVNFGAIAEGAVLSVAKNDYAIEIIVNTENLSGKVTAIGEYIYINDKEFELSRDYAKSRFYVAPKLGENVKAYIDAFGYIAWLDYEKNDDIGGYIMKIYADEETEKSIIRLFTLTGNTETYETEDKVTIVDANNEKLKVKSELLSEYVAQGYVNYSLSEDSKISKIVLPLKNRSDENRLYEMVNDSMSNIRYKSTFKCFSGRTYIGDSTKIILAGKDGNELRLKLADESIFENSTDYNISAYATDRDSMYADCIIYHENTSASINDSDYAAVVLDIKTAINIDDEEIVKATVYRNGAEIDLVATVENGVSIFDKATDVFSSGSYKIQKGDIIKWCTDFDGYVNKIQLIYSPYLKNPSGGEDGYLAGVKYDKYMISSALVDYSSQTNNMYNATSSSQTRTDCNPYAISSGSAQTLAFRFYQSMRTMLGWVYSKKDDIFTLTTQDLSLGECFSASGIPEKEYKDSNMTGVYVIDNIKYYRFNTIYVNYTQKGSSYIPEVRAGALTDIKDYKSYGGDCSRVICVLKSGEPYQLIIIDNDK